MATFFRAKFVKSQIYQSQALEFCIPKSCSIDPFEDVWR